MSVNAFAGALLDHFERRADETFATLVTRAGEERLSYADLEADCRRFAAACEGLEPGGVALIFLRHRRELFGAFLGVMLSGRTPSFMPCSSARQHPDIYWGSHAELLAHIAPAAIIADRATFAEMDGAGLSTGGARRIAVEDLPEPRGQFAPRGEDEIALLQHSSGTTGLKKGVALSARAIVAQLESYGAALAIDRRDVIVSWLPLYHDMGLVACLLLPVYFGAPIAQIDPFHWLAEPDLLFRRIASERGTLVWMPNFAFEHLATLAGRKASTYALGGVRAFISCSEPCRAATMDRFAKTFAPAGARPEQLQVCYAMAETVFAVSQTPPGAAPARLAVAADSLERGKRIVPADGAGAREIVSTGPLIAGIEAAICDEDGNPVAEGIVGEIALSGEFLFDGYNRDRARTAERLRGGRYFSRDLGFLHAGELYVLGRMDDLIIVNGRNLYAHEVEGALAHIEGLKAGRGVAIGQFDARVGSDQLVVICEKARGAARASELIRREVNDRIWSIFAITPRAVHVVDEGWLVKTTSGKISRKANLERLELERANGAAT